MKFRTAIDAKELRDLLSYDADTGVFTWRVARSGTRANRIAGTLKGGYIQIEVNGVGYHAHRLAWLYMTGQWPVGLIDHRDLDKANNRWQNLRPAGSQNNQNRGPSKRSKSGVKGVHPYRNKWHAQIMAKGVRRHLGYFHTLEEASAAYAAAAKKYHGEFARHD